jgi:amidohydrolase
MKPLNLNYLLLCLVFPLSLFAQTPQAIFDKVNQRSNSIESQVIEWRRHFHQYPELSNREFKTAKTIEDYLKGLGLEVQTGIAHTGVVGILRGGKPGPVVALRADMDGLPVVERVDLPFKSVEKANYMGLPVGVMHACGHDTHIAMLMGAAKILSEMKDEIPGTVKFIFQPAEEGVPKGEEGGAPMMVKEGVLKNPNVDAIFGIHINSQTEVGKITYRPGGTMAAADIFRINITGKQTHGSTPWTGIDPIIVASDIVQGFQKIVSRQMDLTENAVVISVGIIQAGVRNNIISESAYMEGTIRTLDYDMQEDIHRRIIHTAKTIGDLYGAEVEIEIQKQTPVTYNDPELTALMSSSLEKVAGKENAEIRKAITGAEDFAFYQLEVPGLFVFVGGMTPGLDPSSVAPHHTPDFQIDESGMKLGVKTYTMLALDYLFGKSASVARE